MTRNFKVLGLALVAIFALSALAASAASAQGKLTSDGPVTLKGTETGANPTAGEVYDNALISPVLGVVTCPGSTYTGHAKRTHTETTLGEGHTTITSGSTTATITPHYAKVCNAKVPVLGNRPVTVTMNGCDYLFHLGATTGGGETYGVTADVICPPGKVIEVHIYKAASAHLDADAICTVKVGEANNQGRTGLHATNTPAANPDDIDISGTVTGIHTDTSGTLCGTNTSTNSSLAVDITVKGYTAGGAETGVTVTD